MNLHLEASNLQISKSNINIGEKNIIFSLTISHPFELIENNYVINLINKDANISFLSSLLFSLS